MSTLEITDLHVSVDTEDGPKEILKGVTSPSKSGETHAIMGPNGSGKSTLAYSIAGHPKYTVTGGTVTLDGEDVLAMTRRRARPRRPVPRDAVPRRGPRRLGVATSCAPPRPRSTARRPSCAPGSRTSRRRMERAQHRPDVRRAQRQRGLLRRREEAPRDPPAGAAQARRSPMLDETDSGLDIDALKIVSEGVNRVHAEHERRRRPADHPLHAHPALHQARLRPRLRRRQDRRGGRPRAGRPPRGRGLRPLPQGRGARRNGGGLTRPADVRPAADADARRDPRRTSRSWRARVRGGRPLVYLDSRRHLAEAAAGARRRARRSTSSTTPRSHRGAHQLAEEATEAFEGARDKVAAFIGAPDRDEVVFTKNATEALNLVAYAFSNAADRGPRTSGSRRPGRRDRRSPRWSTTPTSCRGSSSPGAPARRCAGSASPTTAGSTCRTSTSCHRAHQGRRVHARVQHARHGQPGRRARRARARRRRARRASTRASRCRTCRSTWPRSASTSSRSPATRCSAPRASACSGAAPSCSTVMPPFLTGGSMIETVTMERSTYAPAPQQFEAGVPDDRPGGRPRRGRRLPRPASAWTRSTPTSRRSPSTRSSGLAERPGVRVVGPPRRAAPAAERSRSSSTACTPHDVGQVLDDARRRRAGRAPLRVAAAPRASACRARRARRRLYNDAGRGRRAGRALRPRAGRSSASTLSGEALMDLYQEIILEHYQATRTTRACASRSRPRCTTSTRPAATR